MRIRCYPITEAKPKLKTCDFCRDIFLVNKDKETRLNLCDTCMASCVADAASLDELETAAGAARVVRMRREGR